MLEIIYPIAYREIGTLEMWREKCESDTLQNAINALETAKSDFPESDMFVMSYDVCVGLARQVINERLEEFYGI